MIYSRYLPNVQQIKAVNVCENKTRKNIEKWSREVINYY